MKQRIVHSDPDIQRGMPVFVGTRVPVINLFDCLEAGDSLDQFLRSFPSVSKAQAIAALAFAREARVDETQPCTWVTTPGFASDIAASTAGISGRSKTMSLLLA